MPFALAVIVVCGVLVGLNNAGVLPQLNHDGLVLSLTPSTRGAPTPDAAAPRPDDPAPEPVAESAAPPAPRPARIAPRPGALPLPAAHPPQTAPTRPAPAQGESEPAAHPAPAPPAAKPPAAAPAPTATPATPAPAALAEAIAESGLLTVGERRERLLEATPPAGFTTEWTGGAAVLKVAANEIARGNPRIRRVALTLDGCWDATPVPALLEVLKSQGVRVTFFLTGTFAEKFPGAVRQLAAAGHEIANHSYDHSAFTKLNRAGVSAQLNRTERLLLSLAPDAYRPYFRPPYGDRNVPVLRQLIQSGFLPVYWSLDTLDWQTEATPDSVLERVAAGGVGPGSIILCHLAGKPTVRVLPRLITRLRAADLEPGTLSSVLVP